MSANITNLPVDVLSRILTSVSKSVDSARDVAVSMATCQLFLEASESIVVRGAVSFENVQILGRAHLFQRNNGLLYECAKAGNSSAQYLLAQVILFSSSQMLHAKKDKLRSKHLHIYSPKYNQESAKACDDDTVAIFLSHFTPAQGPNPNPEPLPMSFHWEFVKIFILKCTRNDFMHMYNHLQSYAELFAGGLSPPHKGYSFGCLVGQLSAICSIKEDMLFIRGSGNYCIVCHRDYFTPPPNVVVYDWTHAEALFEEVRAKALDTLEDIIPTLY